MATGAVFPHITTIYAKIRKYFCENMNEIDISNIDEDKLLGLFEQMVRIHYAQR